jgi:hypothetical protein
MDVSNIASLFTAMAVERTDAAAGVAILKKAIDLQERAVVNLLEAVPSLPANPNIGRNINVTA